jgi:hypothetical protein
MNQKVKIIGYSCIYFLFSVNYLFAISCFIQVPYDVKDTNVQGRSREGMS